MLTFGTPTPSTLCCQRILWTTSYQFSLCRSFIKKEWIFLINFQLPILRKLPLFRPNPLQYFLVPDIEVENGDDEDDDDMENEEEIDESVVVLEEEEEDLEEADEGEEEDDVGGDEEVEDAGAGSAAAE